MKNDLEPTITLAELYESQNQVIDAINIYQKLHRVSPSDKIKEKLESISTALLAQSNFKYTKIINQIFSEAELKHFKIVPNNASIHNTAVFEESRTIETEEFLGNEDEDEDNENEEILEEGEQEEILEEDEQEEKQEDIDDYSNNADLNRKIEIDNLDLDIYEIKENSDVVDLIQSSRTEVDSSSDSEHRPDDSEEIESLTNKITEEIPSADIDELKDKGDVNKLSIDLEELQKIKDELTEERKILIDKANEIETKLSQINIDEIKSKLEKLNEEKRDQD